MASIYQLKPAFQSLLRPLVQRLAKVGVTANQITLLACLLSVALGITFFVYHGDLRPLLFFVPVFMFIRMAFNAIDGMLANEHGMHSRLGTFLNELTDVISDTALYYPLALIFGVNNHLAALFVCGSVICEMTGVIGVQVGATRRYDGPLGKSDRAFVFGLLAVLTALELPIAPYMNAVFGILVLLTSVTIFNRVRGALKSAQRG